MDRIKRLFFISIILFIITITLFMGCTSKPGTDHEHIKDRSPHEAVSTLTIAYEEDSLLHLPLYVAIQNKYFEKADLQIKLQKYTSTEEAVEGLLTDKYDLLLYGPELGFFLYQQGQANKVIYLAQCTVQNGWFLLSRKTEPPSAFTWDNTKGKVILGMEIGHFAEIILENILRKQQLRPQFDVHIINNLPSSLRLGAFQSGTGHFFLSTEPATSFLEKEGGYQLIASLSKYIGSSLPSFVIYVAKGNFPAEQENYQKFLNALAQALIWMETHSPEELAATGKEFFPGYNEKILIRGIARYKNLGCWPESPVVRENSLKKLHDFLLQAGELNSAVPDSAINKFFEPSLNPKL